MGMREQSIPTRGIDIQVAIHGEEHLPTVVLLHGFTGSTATWTEVSKRLTGVARTVAIDLTGHGKTTAPVESDRYEMDQQVKDLEALFDHLGLRSFVLVGYSMGGRIALAYTILYPDRVSSLILESASPGLRSENERVERCQADHQLAEKLETDGLPAFVDFWENIPLFHSQKRLSDEVRQTIRQERLGQRATGLANSLRGIGTGSQPSYWSRLGTVHMPVLLLTGEYDTKFINISREMGEHFPTVRHETIPDAGHAIHVEKPDVFATMISEHLLQTKNGGGAV
nr:2-succinyl-6-hydroxy-2,4-cyclohexadiene-1-carboxylate synthase [Sporosarcina sp. ACRSM]